MKKIERIKAKVTSEKWGNDKVGDIILLPVNLKQDFVKYGYGEIVKEEPRETVKPETKKRTRKPKTKE